MRMWHGVTCQSIAVVKVHIATKYAYADIIMMTLWVQVY